MWCWLVGVAQRKIEPTQFLAEISIVPTPIVEVDSIGDEACCNSDGGEGENGRWPVHRGGKTEALPNNGFNFFYLVLM